MPGPFMAYRMVNLEHASILSLLDQPFLSLLPCNYHPFLACRFDFFGPAILSCRGDDPAGRSFPGVDPGVEEVPWRPVCCTSPGSRLGG